MTLGWVSSLLIFVSIKALAIVSVPGHFSAVGQVTYFNLQLAEGINTLDPQMHVCSFGRGAPQLEVTFSNAAALFNLRHRQGAGE